MDKKKAWNFGQDVHVGMALASGAWMTWTGGFLCFLVVCTIIPLCVVAWDMFVRRLYFTFFAVDMFGLMKYRMV